MNKEELIQLLENNEIESADFTDLNLNDEDCIRIGEALLSNNTCYEIILGLSKKVDNNKYGIMMDSRKYNLQMNNSLRQYLTLSSYSISKGFEHIFEALKYNNTVASLQIKNINFKKLTDHTILLFIEMLKINDNLSFLRIPYNFITDYIEFIKALQAHKNLIEISIDDNYFNNENEYIQFINTISSYKHLQVLKLKNCEIKGQYNLPQLTDYKNIIKNNQYLVVLDLRKNIKQYYNKIEDNYASIFNNLIESKYIQYLNIDGYNPSSNDDPNALIKFLHYNRNLRVLDISNISFNNIDKLIEELYTYPLETLKMKDIHNLDISNNSQFTNNLSPLLKLLQDNNNITSLNLSYIQFNRDEVIDLYDLILKNKILTLLNVNYCFNDLSNTIYILDAVKYNKNLDELRIFTKQSITHYWLFDYQFIDKICNLIEYNTHLSTIYIDESDIIFDPDLNSKLTENLNFSYNYIYSSLLRNKTLIKIIWPNLFKASLL